jgi:ABC-type multidrug transport system permease subunit
MKNKNEMKPSTEDRVETPWHLWLIVVLFVLIYSIGVYDFLMVHTNNMDYLNSLNVKGDVIAYFTGYPLAFSVFWTINILGGLIAAFLLMFRSKWAVRAALTATISKFCLDILTFAFLNRWDVFGPLTSLIDVTILLMTSGLFFYCRALLKRGVLK